MSYEGWVPDPGQRWCLPKLQPGDLVQSAAKTSCYDAGIKKKYIELGMVISVCTDPENDVEEVIVICGDKLKHTTNETLKFLVEEQNDHDSQ